VEECNVCVVSRGPGKRRGLEAALDDKSERPFHGASWS